MTPRNRRWSGLAALTAIFMTFGGLALADNVRNDVGAGGNETISAGGSATIDYWIQSGSGGGDQAGCNAADSTKATVNIQAPAGVTASSTSLDFTLCGSAALNTQSVVFSSSTPGSYSITHSVVDLGGGTYTVTAADFTLHVNAVTPTNAAPVIGRDNASVTVDEGATASNTGTWSDANSGDTVTLSASVGTVTKSGTNAAGTWNWSFDTTDGPDDSQTVTITANDGTTSTSTTFGLVVNNVKPSPQIVSLTGNGGVACIGGNTVTLNFSWTDPADTNDIYDYSVNWGDGSTTPATGTTTATSPVNGLQHTYAAGGPYTIQVTVNDNDANAGTTVSSSPFSFLYNVSGVLQPVNDTQAQQDPSIFKHGSTIPVKIRVTDCNGTSVSGLSPTIQVSRVAPNPPAEGTLEPTTSTSGADSGQTMRYDAAGGQYIYNLATKPLVDTTATYRITITGPFSPVTAQFGTKAK